MKKMKKTTSSHTEAMKSPGFLIAKQAHTLLRFYKFNCIQSHGKRVIWEHLQTEKSVTELVAETGLAQAEVSQQLMKLREYNLVSYRQLGRFRLYKSNLNTCLMIERIIDLTRFSAEKGREFEYAIGYFHTIATPLCFRIWTLLSGTEHLCTKDLIEILRSYPQPEVSAHVNRLRRFGLIQTVDQQGKYKYLSALTINATEVLKQAKILVKKVSYKP